MQAKACGYLTYFWLVLKLYLGIPLVETLRCGVSHLLLDIISRILKV